MAKTITVTDEMYDFLMELSKEINNQDNRGTKTPYFFQIEDEEEIEVPYGCGERVWVSKDDSGETLETEEEIKEKVFEIQGWDIKNKDLNEKYDNFSKYVIEDILEDQYNRHYFSTRKVYRNAFLTEKACRKHINANRYHYKDHKTFLTYAERNPELEKVFEFLCGLTSNKSYK